jgi:hypothetical protein
MLNNCQTNKFRKPRMRDVAMLAGVSTATVSHVVNNRGAVGNQTRLKVQAAIETLSYIPDVHARNLALGNRHTIGIMISDTGDPVFSELLKSIYNAASALQCEVIMTSTNFGLPDYFSRVPALPEVQLGELAVRAAEQNALPVPQFSENGMPTALLFIRPLRQPRHR